jgi:hypothetical protein
MTAPLNPPPPAPAPASDVAVATGAAAPKASFVEQNLDKLIAAVIGAVVGFFTAILAVYTQVSDIRSEAASTKTEVTFLKEEVKKHSEHTVQITDLVRRVTQIESEAAGINRVREVLDVLRLQEKNDTINDLEDLLIKAGKLKESD